MHTEQEAFAFYRTALQHAIRNKATFTKFLNVAAQHYKHNVINQIMIFAQEPEAKLVAKKSVWETLGGTAKAEASVISLRRAESRLEIEELYTEKEIDIPQSTIAPYLKNWGHSQVSQLQKILKQKQSSQQFSLPTNIAHIATDKYFNLSSANYVPISWNTCVDLSSYIVGRKLGIIGIDRFRQESFDEMQKMGTSFDKAFQWVSITVKDVFAELQTIIKEELNKNEQGTIDEKGQLEVLWQDGAELPQSKRTGRAGRFTIEGQLTFGDILAGAGTAGRGTQIERSKEILAGQEDRTSAEHQPHGSNTDTPADRERSAGGSERTLPYTDTGAGGEGERPVAAVLPERPAGTELISTQDITVKPSNEPNEWKHIVIDLTAQTEEPATPGYGGAKTKYKNNVLAIKVLKNVEAGQRMATPTEKKLMQRYVGWGGLPQVFDAGRKGWEKEYQELKTLLSDTEYAQARRSTLNAHYTTPEIIRAIYAGADTLGFKGGRLLDPSAGNGRFFSELPAHWQTELHAVEIDSISGRLTAAIHPNANVQIKGYQDVLYPDNYFDGIISNVPFGNYSLADERYNKHSWSIHEYFFGKSLDKVKPGGLIAFITSKYLMDKKDNTFRKYLAARAELVGAVRLPNTAFTGIANTEVTTDILFLKKREVQSDLDYGWEELGMTRDGVPVNDYYLTFPRRLLGNMVFDKSMFGNELDTTCINTDPDFDLPTALTNAINDFAIDKAGIFVPATPPVVKVVTTDTQTKAGPAEEIPADPSVKNYTYTLVENDLYFRKNDSMQLQDITGMQRERIVGMVGVRSILMEVINTQLTDGNEAQLADAQGKLNRAYDTFNKRYGYLNSKANDLAFKEDVDRPLIQSLEKKCGKDLYEKTDIFTKRTIQVSKKPKISSASEALAFSLNQRGRVDLPFMAECYQQDIDTVLDELGDRLFFDPESQQYQTSDEYLSGNVKEKLEYVQSHLEEQPTLKRNETALLQVQPKRLSIADISFQLGTPWVPMEYKLEFIRNITGLPSDMHDALTIKKDKVTTRYVLAGKEACARRCTVNACDVYGTKRRSAFVLFEDCLNQQISTVFDIKEANGKEQRVMNLKETQLARAKQAALQAEFVSWVQIHTERLQSIEDIYNSRFNVYVPRKFNGSFIEISEMSQEIKLKPHQKNAVARIVFGGNTLLAHEVGAGKTYTMAAAAMLGRKTGLYNKPLFVIPNHLLDQWARAFYTIFPTANLLITTKRDFEKQNRMRFISRIATGDYDAVIMTFTQFERIPMSPEFRQKMIQEELEVVEAALSESEGHGYSVKRLEKMRISLEERLEILASEGKKDDTLYFEQLGIDQLFVDEAHNYKNCYVHTKIHNVAGLGGSRADKSFDFLMKTRHLNEKTNYRGVTFATGTPITNSISEMFVMQRYLQNDVLDIEEIAHFDEWAGTYAKIENVLEIAPEGTGYRDRARFTSFNNLPELMAMFHLVADIQLVEDMDIVRPSIAGGKPQTILIPPSEYVENYIAELSERAEKVRAGSVDASKDNMLLITANGRNVAIDPRLIDPNAPVNRDSKIYAACDKIAQIYHEYNSDKALQLAFLDVGMPMYTVMKEDLVMQGIPEHEVAFIHDAKTDKQKAELFDKCRSGEVRVLIGSTAKMGAGTDIQDRMIALHDIDCPWRPSDLEQRHGRILRQGNMFKEAHIFQYVTKGTFDSYLFQTIENKQKIIGQVMTNKSPARSCADIDETVLNYSEIKALAAGDPRIKEKMELDNQVSRLSLERSAHLSAQGRLKTLIEQSPKTIAKLEERASFIQQDLQIFQAPAEFLIMIGAQQYNKRVEAAKALDEIMRAAGMGKTPIGSYACLELVVNKTAFTTHLALVDKYSYPVELGTSSLGNITRIENMLGNIVGTSQNTLKDLANIKGNFVNAQEHYGEAFPKSEELKALLEKQAELNFQLEMEIKGSKSAEQDEPAMDDIENGEKPELFVGDVFELDDKKWKVKSNNGFMLSADNLDPNDGPVAMSIVGNIKERDYKLIKRGDEYMKKSSPTVDELEAEELEMDIDF